MVKIGIVSALFPPEPVVSARLTADLAAYLSESGHDVTVVCPPPSRPAGIHFPVFLRESDEFRVVQLASFTAPKSTVAGRLLESFSFGWQACRALGEGRLFDVVYANTWPIVSTALLARHCARHGIPFVNHVQDIYPESFVDRLPARLRRIISRPLMRLERWTLERTDHVILVGESTRRVFEAGRPGVQIHGLSIVSNWQDERPFGKCHDRTEVCRQFGIDPSKRVLLFLGNIGPVADVPSVIDAFVAASLVNTVLVLVGEGSAKEICQKRAKNHLSSDIRFLSDPDPNNVARIQCMADVCILPMRAGAGAASVPSKLVAYMLSAKPVIGVVDSDSDTADSIRRSGCGWVVSPSDLDEIAKTIRLALELAPKELELRGRAGAVFARTEFGREKGLRRISEIVIESARSAKEHSV